MHGGRYHEPTAVACHAIRFINQVTQNEQGGLDVVVEDLKTLPYSIWGKAKKTFFGFDVSARGKVDSRFLDNIDLDIQANGPTTSFQLLGKGGESTGVIGLNFLKIFSTLTHGAD